MWIYDLFVQFRYGYFFSLQGYKKGLIMALNIRCPKCFGKISSMEEERVYLCSPCNLYFAREDYEKLRKKYLHINTEGLSISEDKGELKIVCGWHKNYLLMIFSLFWTYLSFSSFVPMLDDIFENGLNHPFVLVYPSISILLLYWVSATFINSTSIVVTQEAIRVFCSPLPWPGVNTHYKIRHIEQIYVEKYASYRQNNQPVYRYKVILKERGACLDLVKGIERYEQAVTIENYMERYLDIQDKPVEDEYTT